MRTRNFLLIATLGAGWVSALVGCASREPVVVPEFRAVSSQPAQLQRFTRDELLLGEAIFARGPGTDLALRFSKGPAQMIEVLRVDDVWYASGKLAWRPWSGDINQAPARLYGWMVLLSAYDVAPKQPEGESTRRSGDDWSAYLRLDGRLVGISTRSRGENFRVRFGDD